MLVKGTYFQNSEKNPLVYGDVEIHNIPRRRLRGEEEKEGIIAESVFVGFCGTDYTLMNMGREGNLKQKFPEGCNRLINGHEGVVWVPDENRFAIVLIRGGNSYDPTRYTEEETYFEYGCDQADGLFSDKNYYNPDMLLKIPDGYVKANEHSGCSKTKNTYSVKCFFSGNLPRFCFTAFILCHFHPEILCFPDILHPFSLKDHAGIWIAKHKLFTY